MKTVILFLSLIFSTCLNAQTILPVLKVLMYHHITDELLPGQEMISPQVFAQQMKALDREGYKTLTVSEAIKHLDAGDLPQKSIVLTFDDGWKSQLNAAGILAEHDFTGTFYIISGMVNMPRYMNVNDIRWVSERFEIGAHSVTHFMDFINDLTKISSARMINEMVQSKSALERLLGKPVKTLAWPFGYSRPEVVEAIKARGFTSQMMIYTGAQNSKNNAHGISRINIDGRCSLDSFLTMVKTGIEQRCSK
jgi:peptidoglycan/xylan/chitin deacetylase (PgdA/CDA1 family)